MIRLTFTRAGNPPHVTALANAIRALIPGSFHVSTQPGAVYIETASWDGVDLQAIQDQVTAAPDTSTKLDAKVEADRLPLVFKAFFQVLVDELNRLRQNPTTTYAAITYAQAWSAVKAKVDTL